MNSGMQAKYTVTGSIVLYRNPRQIVEKVISGFDAYHEPHHLFLLDNSEAAMDDYNDRANTTYIFNGKNLGYGRAHNIAMSRALEESEFHLVMNPDIEMSADAITECIRFMRENINVGLLMPKVLY